MVATCHLHSFSICVHKDQLRFAWWMFYIDPMFMWIYLSRDSPMKMPSLHSSPASINFAIHMDTHSGNHSRIDK
jgi:hypothetical protein